MCGIFGIVTNKNEDIYNLIINGLKQLQNRGYDSAGLSVIENGTLKIHKFASTDTQDALAKLQNLNLTSQEKITIGIGHNRWATHGIKNDINSHPHLSNNKNFVIVHNGIIENYNELKEHLIKHEYKFYSQTDTEVIINLIEYNFALTKNVFLSIQNTIYELKGTYGLLIMCLHEPNKLFCVRNGSPLLIGKNKDFVIITSEQSGFCGMMNNYITLNNDDICTIEKQKNSISVETTCKYAEKNVSLIATETSPYPYVHWTLKEINEQPNTVINAINRGGRIKNGSEVKLGGLERNIDLLKNINNIIILGCGTSYFAGLYGMYFFKQICNFNTVQVFDGAELQDYDIPKIGNTAFILISQSGETKDLHRCIQIAKTNNITTIGIINMVDSLVAREVDCGIYCNAGKEVGVASTKAFTSQVVCLSMAAVWFSTIQGINEKKREKIMNDLNNLAKDVQVTIDECKDLVMKLAEKMTNASNLFLLGKGSDDCIAKEGSLKIKEMSYIHSEGYSASSLKHGPFSLLDEKFPVIILNLDIEHRAKILNCCQEVNSRNSPIIFITNDKTIKNELSCDTIYVSENKTYASLLGLIPIQLLSYYLSVNKGINPDKPKNLAKVVTVE